MIEQLETRRLLSGSGTGTLYLVSNPITQPGLHVAVIGEGAFQLAPAETESPVAMSITGRGTLNVQGSSGNDVIDVITDDSGAGVVSTRVGDTVLSQRFENVNRIVIEGAAGNDRITFIGSKNIPVTIVGGAGNDRLEARGRKVTLSGGSGNDDLIGRGMHPIVFYGGSGHDRFMGTRGVDTIFGGSGQDRADRSAGADEIDSIEIRETLDL